MSMRLQGRLVHYVMADGKETIHGQCRPALVVQDWETTEWDLGANPLINLMVFFDGSNDGVKDPAQVAAYGDQGAPPSLIEWRGSSPYDRHYTFGSWHRPEDCRR